MIKEEEGNELAEEMEKHESLGYYVMKYSYVDEDKTIFKCPDMAMQQHLKSLFIRVKVDNVGMNKTLVDGGTSINIMSHSLLGKLISSAHTQNPTTWFYRTMKGI